MELVRLLQSHLWISQYAVITVIKYPTSFLWNLWNNRVSMISFRNNSTRNMRPRSRMKFRLVYKRRKGAVHDESLQQRERIFIPRFSNSRRRDYIAKCRKAPRRISFRPADTTGTRERLWRKARASSSFPEAVRELNPLRAFWSRARASICPLHVIYLTKRELS